MEFVGYFAQFLCLVLFHFHFDRAASSSSLSLNSSSLFSSFQQLLCPFDQSHALLQFKASFSIATFASPSFLYKYVSYPKTESWKEGTDCCLWDGVSCDLETGNVIGLNLSFSMLYGTFHSHNSLFLLSHLQNLDLAYNDFNNSVIPFPFGHLLNLRHLNLNSSRFAGKVPSQISNLSNLVSLDLSCNVDLILDRDVFDGIVQNLSRLKELTLSAVDMSMVPPNSFMTLSSSLTSLQLGDCGLPKKFLEYVSLPSSLVSLDLSANYNFELDTASFNKIIQNLTKLRELTLSRVDMSMVAPISFMNLSSSLASLQLGDCRLPKQFLEYVNLPRGMVRLNLFENNDMQLDTGEFVNLVQNLTKLTFFDLSSVNLSLVAPTSLMNLSSSLRYLYLYNCSLRGELPGNLVQQPNLAKLDLGNNVDLTGFFPESNWSSSLETLDISWTNITIFLEPNFIDNLRSRKSLYLDHINFHGSNLALLGSLVELRLLSLSQNNFNGEISSSFGNLQQLICLSLSSNNFTGAIPASFKNLKQLTYLEIGNNSLSGPLPVYLSNFTQLSYLNVSNNRLTGSIPFEIGRLSRLKEIDLSNNFFNSTIPSFNFTLPKLRYLSLKNNQFYGRIGEFQSKSLSFIDLSNNKLQGLIPTSIFNLIYLQVLILSSNDKLTGELSPSICNLNSLQILDLSNNNLTSSIPQCVGNFSNSLSVLHLGGNNFHGPMPMIFSNENSLRYLNFNGNQLQGHIPPSIVNCKFLEILDLGNNKINDTFPIFLGSLSNLQVLVLHSNKLQGCIKSSVINSSFSSLRILDLSRNEFGGPLPAKFFNELHSMMNFKTDMKYMSDANTTYSYDYSVSMTLKGLEIESVKIQTTLTTLDLSCNKFIRKIPDLIGNLKALKHLNLSYNSLTGNIPPSLGNLANLESLDLASNLLTGTIPTELVGLTFLAVFHVSHNQLEGRIPLGNQFSTFEKDSYEGNLKLCGFPLTKACEDGDVVENVKRSNIQEEDDDSGFANGFGWYFIMIGYGCGLVFGVSMSYIMFTTKRLQWFVEEIESAGHHTSKLLRNKFLKGGGRRN